MAKTYTPIATSTMTVNSPSITFSSIPAGYTDLKLIITFKRDNAGGAYLRFNGDSGSNYSQTFLEGNGSTIVSVRAANQSFAYVDYNADTTNNGIYSIDLMNYSNTTTYKTYLASAVASASALDKTVGLWRSTSAISTILIASSNGGNYFAGSSATLYGILKA